MQSSVGHGPGQPVLFEPVGVGRASSWEHLHSSAILWKIVDEETISQITSNQNEMSFRADEMKIKITLSIRNPDFVEMISVRFRQM